MQSAEKSLFTAIGAISGTSMDAIDVALVETDGAHHVRPLGGGAYPYPEALRESLRSVIADAARAERDSLEDLETEVTRAFADAIRLCLADMGVDPAGIDLVGFHGQTVFHRPERRVTRQLGDGPALARALGMPVVYRFRHADVAAGGQGAPLVPLYHAALAASLPRPLVVLNLGGVANVTYLDGETILAFDTGPASALIDDAMQRHFGLDYDADGQIATRGRVSAGLLATLIDNPFFAAKPPKSLDRNDFHRRSRIVESLSAEDQIATLTAFTVAATARALTHFPERPSRWLVTGGGRHNRAMMRGFADALEVPVEPVETVGWNGDLLEAECFAYLAARSRRGLPLSLPTTTGVPAPMPGGEFCPPQAFRRGPISSRR
ncbi:MAG TPA: anhydro-N-acetylmuramic acid kinase [Rhabdaerophilum sp.]|nr:anhydro-N-acetylmuramic acid kinase [Rhabdaerophilum sp.]